MGVNGSLLAKSDLPINFPVKIKYMHVTRYQVHSDLIIFFHGWVNSKLMCGTLNVLLRDCFFSYSYPLLISLLDIVSAYVNGLIVSRVAACF